MLKKARLGDGDCCRYGRAVWRKWIKFAFLGSMLYILMDCCRYGRAVWRKCINFAFLGSMLYILIVFQKRIVFQKKNASGRAFSIRFTKTCLFYIRIWVV